MKLTNDEAIQILNAGLATGADFAEIYLQDSKSENIARRYQKPYGVSKSHTIGAGIRLRKGKQTVYGYSSDISVPALISLAKSLSYGFDGSREKVLSQLVEKKFSDLCPRKFPFSAKNAGPQDFHTFRRRISAGSHCTFTCPANKIHFS